MHRYLLCILFSAGNSYEDSAKMNTKINHYCIINARHVLCMLFLDSILPWLRIASDPSLYA